FSPDGRWLAASASKGLGVWDLTGGGPGAVVEKEFASDCFFSADGRELFGNSSKVEGNDCFRWRLRPAVEAGVPPALEQRPFPKPEGFTFLSVRSNCVALTTANGSQLLAPEVLETGSDRWIGTSPGLNGMSPDGRWLAIYRPFSTTLYLYNLPELEPVAK